MWLFFIIPAQIFINLDGDTGTGYGKHGYDVVIRLGVAFHTLPQFPPDGVGPPAYGPNGWGPEYRDSIDPFGKKIKVENYTPTHEAVNPAGDPYTWWQHWLPLDLDLNRDGLITIGDLHPGMGLFAYYRLQQEIQQ